MSVEIHNLGFTWGSHLRRGSQWGSQFGVHMGSHEFTLGFTWVHTGSHWGSHWGSHGFTWVHMGFTSEKCEPHAQGFTVRIFGVHIAFSGPNVGFTLRFRGSHWGSH